MKLTKDFMKIKEKYPNVKFGRNCSGPGVLITINNEYVFYENKKYSFNLIKYSIDEFLTINI
jgi:hypothetical protein